MNKNKNNLVLFSHIPKTAGSSFSNLLIENYGVKVIVGIGRKKRSYNEVDIQYDIKYFPWIKIIRGHEVKLSNINPDNYKVITFLRDPIDRLVSHYVHQFTGNDSLYQIPFEEWLERFDRSNYLFKWISQISFQDTIEKLSHENVTFGLLDRFEESLSVIAQNALPNIRAPRKVKSRMITRDKKLFNNTKKILLNTPSLVNKHLEIDIEIYKKASKDLFSKQKNDTKYFIPNTLGVYEQKINRYIYTGFKRIIYNSIKK